MGNKINAKVRNLIIAIVAAIIAVVTIAVVKNNKVTTEEVAKTQINEQELLRSINYDQVQEGDEKVDGCDNKVNFSAYFAKDIDGDGRAEKLYGSCQSVKSRSQLYIDVNVEGDGHIESGVITIDGKNFKLEMNMLKDSLLKNNVVSSDVQEIELNNVVAGNSEILIGNISSKILDNESYTQVNQVTLTGTYVPLEGNPVQISKTIDLTVDWYGTTSAYVFDGYTRYSRSLYIHDENRAGDDEKLTEVEFKFSVKEQDEQLIAKGQHVEVTIPQCVGQDPVTVTTLGEYSYNPETRVLTIDKETSSRRVDYVVRVKYMQSSLNSLKWSDSGYSLIAKIKAKTICYNNQNEEFTNPLVSSEAPGSAVVSFEIIPQRNKAEYIFDTNMYTNGWHNGNYGKVLSKQPIYDRYNVDEDVEDIPYTVRWSIRKKGDMASCSDAYIVDYSDQINGRLMGNYIRYTGIEISSSSYLPEGGTVKVYNIDTNELIKEFSSQEVSRGITYYYDEGVDIRHIRVEASKSNICGSLEILNYKVLEVNKIAADFTLQEVQNMTNLYTKSTGHGSGMSGMPVTTSDSATLVGDASEIKLDFSDSVISSTETLENEIITISTLDGYAEQPWGAGVYLVEIPSQIVKVQINDVSITNGYDVLGYEVYQENGKNYIKVVTDIEKGREEGYPTIRIDCNLVPDPRSSSGVLNVGAYAWNEYTNAYWNGVADKYDLDADGNVQELVTYSSKDLGMAASSTFVTVETISDYNEKGDITIAPNVAEITNETREATVNVTVQNNYPNKVENVVVLGKVPFEGNTYVGGSSLRSTFTTTMQDTGIEIPTYLQGKVTVYYTDVENPTNDVETAANGWKEASEWTSLQNIKNYLIVIDKAFNQREGYTFTYKITVPTGLSSNDAAYSCHKVWFDLNTSEGKLNLVAQPTKTGVRVVRPYNFELTKYKEGTNLRIPGAVFKIWEEVPEGEEDNARIRTTGIDGKININGLVVNQVYNVEEIKSPASYMLNEGAVQYKVQENSSGNLEFVQLSQKTFATTPVLSQNESGVDVLQTTLTDKPKYKLDVTKIDSVTGEGIQGIAFGFEGKTYTTKSNGKLELNNLVVGQDYTLTEINADGYFILVNNIEFKVVENGNGGYTFVSGSEYIEEIPEIVSDDSTALINVPITINNTPIPRFNFVVEKVEKDHEDVKLQDARFMLRSQDKNNATYHVTDENGLITLNNLYQRVEDENVTGLYTLQEVNEPYGYMLNKEQIEFYVVENDNEELEVNVTDRANLKTLKDVQIEGKTIKFIIQDQPLFKITKVDKDTGLPLANAKFTIYELDSSSGARLDFAKDANGEYVGTLNEDGYYELVSDENGEITAPLRDGKYKLVEISAPEGYEDKPNEQIFEVSGSRKSSNITMPDLPSISMTFDRPNTFEVSHVEDLLTIAKNVNEGINTYSDTKVILTADIDFRDASCYRDVNDTSFGDINKDGTIEGIKAELDGEKGYGFPQIGRPYNSNEDDGALSDKTITTRYGYTYLAFQGTIDGQNHEIKNLYIKKDVSDSFIGLFRAGKNVTIKNLGITGKIEGKGYAVGSFVGYADSLFMDNCYSKCNFDFTGFGPSRVGGLVGETGTLTYMNECYNEGNIDAGSDEDTCYQIGGLIGQTNSPVVVINKCYNKGSISVQNAYYIGGLIGEISASNAYVYDSYNEANIVSGTGNEKGGLIGQVGVSSLFAATRSYNTGNITAGAGQLIAGLFGAARGRYYNGKRLLQ